MLFLMALSLSCASSQLRLPPTLTARTLRISNKADFAGFEYSYEVCAKEILGFCRKTEMKTDFYDLKDPVVKKQLQDMGFVLRVRDKIIP